MAKTIRFKEIMHEWSGVAIVREEGTLIEVPLGVVHTDKKLKETGVKDLFQENGLVPQNAIAIEVVKNVDVVTVYEMSVDEFTKSAKVVTVDEEDSEVATVETQE